MHMNRFSLLLLLIKEIFFINIHFMINNIKFISIYFFFFSLDKLLADLNFL